MITYDDWSNLIIVNYDGGMGGDFFSSLLDTNFNSSTTLQKNDRYAYQFVGDVFDTKFKVLSSFFRSKVYNETHNQNEFRKDVDFLHQQIFVKDDYSQTIHNLRETILQRYADRFLGKRVIACHFFIENLTLQDLFPKSHNIFLGSNNPNYVKMTRLLLMYKVIIKTLCKLEDGKLGLPFSAVIMVFDNIDQLFEYVVKTESKKDNELFVDMYDFVVRGKSIDQQLSHYTNHNVTMDPLAVSSYKEQSKQILSRYGINIDKEYDSDTFTMLVYNAVEKMVREKNDY